MNDDELIRSLEQQLGKMRPAEISAGLEQRVGESMAPPPLTWADRAMAGFMTLSAAAALYIVVAATAQLLDGGTASPRDTPAAAVARSVNPILEMERQEREWALARR